jgi:hypothetical protein
VTLLDLGEDQVKVVGEYLTGRSCGHDDLDVTLWHHGIYGDLMGFYSDLMGY